MIAPAFLRLDSASTEDMLTDAAVHVLAEKGGTGLTMRAIGEWLRVTPPRVSQMVTRNDLDLVVTARFAQRWAEWIEYRRWMEGPLALLPLEPEEIAGVRVWLALREIARSRPELAEILHGARRRERAVVTGLHGVDLCPAELDLLEATVEGLRTRLCDPVDPLALIEARSRLTRLLTLLGDGLTDARPA